MDLKSQGQLVTGAKELKKLDEQVVNCLKQGNVKDLLRYMVEFSELRKQIKIAQIDFSVASIYDPVARQVLIKVNQNDSFEADKIVQVINSRTSESVILEQLEDDDINALSSKLYEWFSHYEYIEGLYDIGSLIVGVSLPATLISYLDEAKQCYALQQYNAMNALCRTVLELALKQYAERRKLLSKAIDKVGEYETYRSGVLIRLVTNRTLKDKAQALYCRMSAALHGGRQINAKEGKAVFKEMLSVVQDLYG